MKTYYFDGEGQLVGEARSGKPAFEFALLVAGLFSHNLILKYYKEEELPFLNRDSCMGVGRNLDEAKNNVALKGEHIREFKRD